MGNRPSEETCPFKEVAKTPLGKAGPPGPGSEDSWSHLFTFYISLSFYALSEVFARSAFSLIVK